MEVKSVDNCSGSQVLADTVLAESQRLSAELNYLPHFESDSEVVDNTS